LEEAEYAKCDKCKSINKVPEANNGLAGNKEDFVSENENNFNVQVPYMVKNIIF